MNGRNLFVMLGMIALISACSSPGSDIIIDPAYVDRAQYEQDLAECERLADQVRQKAGELDPVV